MTDFTAIRQKMEAAGEREAAILAFQCSYDFLTSGEQGMISESQIVPPEEVFDYQSLPETDWGKSLLDQAVVIKLNGGLGTGMGLQKAKSLLQVKEDRTFLDLIAGQIIHLRQSTQANVRCLFMNSFSTSEDTISYLSKYADQGLADADQVELMQSRVPKLDAESMAPATHPENPANEWCPPGHGDIYTSLEGSGWLDRLLADGIKYAFVSNSDNLGATLCPKLLSHFANNNLPFMMEVTRRTQADKKGGHLAKRITDGQLLLREVAQCPDEDAAEFQNIDKHRYFNTNNLWVNLVALKEAMTQAGGVLPLPTIKNKKTVDPRDKTSTPVWQLETAMGAAIESFPGSAAINVPRSRFAPVKTTSDLFALRSDAYEVRPDSSLGLVKSRNGIPPVVTLSDHYKMLDGLANLGPVPSLLNADSLNINGPITFAEGVTIKGQVSFTNEAEAPKQIEAGLHEGVQSIK